MRPRTIRQRVLVPALAALALVGCADGGQGSDGGIVDEFEDPRDELKEDFHNERAGSDGQNDPAD